MLLLNDDYFHTGIAFSKNGGLSFTEGKTVPVDANYAGARYASFPTETTWYVSLGQFPEAPAPPPSRAPGQDGKVLFTDELIHRHSKVFIYLFHWSYDLILNNI